MSCNFCSNEWDIVYSRCDEPGLQSMNRHVKTKKIDDSACVSRLAGLLSSEESRDDLMAQIAKLVRQTGRPVPDVYV